jgi:hypothetical protein
MGEDWARVKSMQVAAFFGTITPPLPLPIEGRG